MTTRTIRKLRTVAPTLPLPSEHQSQAAFFARVAMDPRTRDLPIFAIPNGGKRHVVTAMKLKAEGVKAGVPDIFVAVPMLELYRDHDVMVEGVKGHGLFIEMKKKGNTPTTEQRAWIVMLSARDYAAAVCYSADEAWQTLCAYLNLTPR